MRTGEYLIEDFVRSAEAELRHYGVELDLDRYIRCLVRALQSAEQEETLYFNTFRGQKRVWLPPYVKDIKAVHYFKHPVVEATGSYIAYDNSFAYVSVNGEWRHIGDIGDDFLIYSQYLAEKGITSVKDNTLPAGFFWGSKNPFTPNIGYTEILEKPMIEPLPSDPQQKDLIFYGSEIPTDWNKWAWFKNLNPTFIYTELPLAGNLFPPNNNSSKYLILIPRNAVDKNAFKRGGAITMGFQWETIEPHTGHTFGKRYQPKDLNYWIHRPPYLEFRDMFPYTGVRNLIVEATVRLPKWEYKCLFREMFPSLSISTGVRYNFASILYRSLSYYLLPMLPNEAKMLLQMSETVREAVSSDGDFGSVRPFRGDKGTSWGFIPENLDIHRSDITFFGGFSAPTSDRRWVHIRIFHPTAKDLLWAGTVREASYVIIPFWVRAIVEEKIPAPPTICSFIEMTLLTQDMLPPNSITSLFSTSLIPTIGYTNDANNLQW